MRTTILTALLVLTTGCANTTTLVYKPDGTKQCEPATTSLANSTNQLTTAGVNVLTSSCATQTGMAVMAVCGAPTLGIHLHEIQANDVQKAKSLGYEEASNLTNQNSGTGYETTDCP